ncbi:MLP423-like protein [Hibiscus syriacus]|uniref:MLP423-like protein n=1 Tax=Hibiscus syriacus TaxID=106335 RepID=A0A6A2ZFI8_HIBSY|nr:MLP-like protein 423 [Hibiscus syriacus]KAE8690804.1 MLP423-like protein [Hibiscus syriacus]
MACNGKLEVEVELKSPAEKVWDTLMNSTTIFPQALPHDYKSIQVLEGDGKSPGTIRLFTYKEGCSLVKVSKEKIELVDEAEKIYVYSIFEGDLMKYYKSVVAKIVVVPKGQSSLIKWSCEFEKVSEDIPDPNTLKEFAVKNFLEIDEYLQTKA